MTELARQLRNGREWWRLMRGETGVQWLESITVRSLERNLDWAYVADTDVTHPHPPTALEMAVNACLADRVVSAEIAIIIRNAPQPHRLAERLKRLWSDRGRWKVRVEGLLLIVPVPASLAQAARDEIDRILASE